MQSEFFRELISCIFPEANYVCKIWRLGWTTEPRWMDAIKIFLTCVSRELFKYWRVKAENEFPLMCIIPVPWKHRGNHQLRVIQGKTLMSRCYLFCWFVCECVCKRERIRNYCMLWTEVWYNSMIIDIEAEAGQKTTIHVKLKK